jgi:hypothetical protein
VELIEKLYYKGGRGEATLIEKLYYNFSINATPPLPTLSIEGGRRGINREIILLSVLIWGEGEQS